MPNELNQLTVNFIEKILVRCEEVGVDEVLKEYENLMLNRHVSSTLLGALLLIILMLYANVLGIHESSTEYKDICHKYENLINVHDQKVSAFLYLTGFLLLYTGFMCEKLYNKKIFPLQQGALNRNIWKFMNNVKIDGKLAFDILFNEKMEDNISRGLCVGLSQLFLHCAFISDMQDQQNFTQENDLNWFYKHILLLQFSPGSLSPESQHDLVDFISLVLHLQGANRIPNDNPKVNYIVRQYASVLNMEFTGKHKIEWSDHEKYATLDALFEMLSTAQEPCYFSVSIEVEKNKYDWAAHAISIHKTKDGKYRYYDPNSSFFDINLSTKADLEQFIRYHLDRLYRPSREGSDCIHSWLLSMSFMTGKPVLKPEKSNTL